MSNQKPYGIQLDLEAISRGRDQETTGDTKHYARKDQTGSPSLGKLLTPPMNPTTTRRNARHSGIERDLYDLVEYDWRPRRLCVSTRGASALALRGNTAFVLHSAAPGSARGLELCAEPNATLARWIAASVQRLRTWEIRQRST